jgi:hypothetical protein
VVAVGSVWGGDVVVVGSVWGGDVVVVGSVWVVAVVVDVGSAVVVWLTASVVVWVVVATASVVVATGSEALVVVTDPLVAATPLMSLISRLRSCRGSPVFQLRLPGRCPAANSEQAPLFFRCHLGEKWEAR